MINYIKILFGVFQTSFNIYFPYLDIMMIKE